MAGTSTEREDERLARHIVSTVLGVPVCRFEDGTADGQVDALVRYPDRVAALEIVSDPDKHFHRHQYQLQDSATIELEDIPDSWMVTLSREANPKKVADALPELLPRLRDSPTPKRPHLDIKPSELVWLRIKLERLGIDPSELDRLGIKPSELDRLGIISADRIENGPAGRVWLNFEVWGVGTGDERTIGEWVTRVLVEKACDVPKKLREHPGDVAERHAFIWAIPTSDRGVLAQLEPGDDHPLPLTPPTLPEGVTHIWAASLPWSQGVLAWFPDRGWWRPPWSRPAECLK